MTADQPPLPGMVSASEHEADMRSRGDDPTPRGVVRAVLEQALGRDSPAAAGLTIRGLEWMLVDGARAIKPLRVLDICAGYGCWASELRRLAAGQGWPVHITGVEIDERKRELLAKWCDIHAAMDWRRWCSLRELLRGGANPMDAAPLDLVIGNPDFSHILRSGKHPDPKKRTAYRPAVETMPAVLLRHAPAVLLLHTSGAFTDSPHGRDVWRTYPPAATWLCGRISFRSDGKTDSRCYQATLWLRGHTGPCATHMLPKLPDGARRWVKLPGTEDALEAKALGLPMVGEP